MIFNVDFLENTIVEFNENGTAGDKILVKVFSLKNYQIVIFSQSV